MSPKIDRHAVVQRESPLVTASNRTGFSAASRVLGIPELLHQILFCVKTSSEKGSTTDVYNLLLVNKAFYSASLPLLYSHASCAAGIKFGSYPSWSKEKEAKFKSSIKKNAGLAKLVRSIHCSTVNLGNNARDGNSWFIGALRHQEMLEMLDLCPRLESLSIYLDYFGDLMIVGSSVGDRLRHLELDESYCDSLSRIKEAADTFTSLSSLHLSGWTWEAVSTFGAVIGNQLQELSVMHGGSSRIRFRPPGLRLCKPDWASLFSRTPQLRRLSLSYRAFFSLPETYPDSLHDIQLHRIDRCQFRNFCAMLSNAGCLPRLRHLPYVDMDIVSIEARDRLDLTYDMEVIIGAAVESMEERKDWLRDESEIAKFKDLIGVLDSATK